METKYYVIAGHVSEYTAFAKRKSQEMWDAGNTNITMSHFVYVSDYKILMGLRHPTGFFVGSWKNRPDIGDILAMLKVICTSDPNKIGSLLKIYEEYDK
jgi:hypothetical protein